MPISQFSTGCDCDCCVVFDTRFCEWINENLDDNDIGGVAYPIASGGEFVEAKDFSHQREFCTGDENCDAESSGYYHYETYAFAFPNTGPGSPDYARLAFVNPLTRYSWFTWMQFDHIESPTLTPYRNRVYFMFDYTDEDNWIAAGVEYEPDYSITPGAPDQIFKVNLYQSVAGTASLLYGASAEKIINLGSGDKKVDVLIQVNVKDCDASTNSVSVQIGDNLFTGDVVSWSYTPDGGGKSCIAPEYSAEYTTETVVCDGQNKTAYTHQQIYKMQVQRHEDDLAGCQTWGIECTCDCAPALEYDVTITGLANPVGGCGGGGTDCEDFNTTFTLTRDTSVVYTCPGSGGLPCTWAYEESGYSPLSCDITRIELFKCASSNWILDFYYWSGLTYELIARFTPSSDDCNMTNLDMGSVTGGCWDDDTPSGCPDPLCDDTNIVVKVSAS
jgi:hypothetical protein